MYFSFKLSKTLRQFEFELEFNVRYKWQHMVHVINLYYNYLNIREKISIFCSL